MSESRDDGTVLVLVLGCVVAAMLLVAVVTDSAQLYLARRSLDSVTDAAALAGAQAVDLDAVYAGRARGDVPLDPVRVRRAVVAHLDSAVDAGAIDRVRLVRVAVDDDAVTVTTSTRVRLPFTGAFTGGRGVVTVRTSATARNRLSP